MRYMLDTDIASYVIRGDQPILDARLARLTPGEIAISAVTRAELHYGLARRPQATRLAQAVKAFLLYVDTCPFDARVAEHYGKLRAQLEADGTPIGDHDTVIAAGAIVAGMTLVTNNTAHFRRVPGLVVENWVTAQQSVTLNPTDA